MKRTRIVIAWVLICVVVAFNSSCTGSNSEENRDSTPVVVIRHSILTVLNYTTNVLVDSCNHRIIYDSIVTHLNSNNNIEIVDYHLHTVN